MKRGAWLVATVVLMVFATVAAASSGVITLKVNGSVIPSDVPPMNVKGRVLVPIRVVSEALGAQVQWDGDTQTVLITRQPEGVGTDSTGLLEYRTDFSYRNLSSGKAGAFVQIKGEVINNTGDLRKVVKVRAIVYGDKGPALYVSPYVDVKPGDLEAGAAGTFVIEIPSYVQGAKRFDLTTYYFN